MKGSREERERSEGRKGGITGAGVFIMVTIVMEMCGRWGRGGGGGTEGRRGRSKNKNMKRIMITRDFKQQQPY